MRCMLFIVFFAVVSFTLGWRLKELRHENVDSFPLSSLSPSVVNILSLGHKELYLDFAYLWLIQKLAEHPDRPPFKDASRMLSQIQMVTRHQPKIESLYTLSCFVLANDYHRSDLCENIANDGIAALPSSWLIPTVVAYMFAFVLQDPLKGAFYYKKAAAVSNCPEYIRGLANRILNRSLNKEDSIQNLRAIIEGTQDEDYRKFLRSYLQKR